MPTFDAMYAEFGGLAGRAAGGAIVCVPVVCLLYAEAAV
jgi:hypothetical protein